MMKTKYDFSIPTKIIEADINRLTNQLWKLIPMKENDENWQGQLDSVTIEIAGLQEIFNVDFLIILTKLEGLRNTDVEFDSYRTTVFKCISLLREMRQ